MIRVLVSLLPSYPSTSPPQLQLLSKYIGSFGVDSSLFGSILRTFISTSGVEWTADAICVFDGLESVSERCLAWYNDRLSAEKASELEREDAKDDKRRSPSIEPEHEEAISVPSASLVAIPEGVQIVESEAITDRKSVFIGRACRISHPSQVRRFTHSSNPQN